MDFRGCFKAARTVPPGEHRCSGLITALLFQFNLPVYGLRRETASLFTLKHQQQAAPSVSCGPWIIVVLLQKLSPGRHKVFHPLGKSCETCAHAWENTSNSNTVVFYDRWVCVTVVLTLTQRWIGAQVQLTGTVLSSEIVSFSSPPFEVWFTVNLWIIMDYYYGLIHTAPDREFLE